MLCHLFDAGHILHECPDHRRHYLHGFFGHRLLFWSEHSVPVPMPVIMANLLPTSLLMAIPAVPIF